MFNLTNFLNAIVNQYRSNKMGIESLSRIKLYMKGCGSAGEKWGVVGSFSNRNQQRDISSVIWLKKPVNYES